MKNIFSQAKDRDVDMELLDRTSYEVWNNAKTGQIPSEELWKRCAEIIGITAEEFRSNFIKMFSFDDELLDLAKKLKQEYRMVLITNNIKDWFEEERKLRRLDDVFELIVTSYEEGIAKPNQDIYRSTCSKIGVKPEECVFIDDKRRNTDSAAQLGMHTILYTSLEEFRKELQKLLGRPVV